MSKKLICVCPCIESKPDLVGGEPTVDLICMSLRMIQGHLFHYSETAFLWTTLFAVRMERAAYQSTNRWRSRLYERRTQFAVRREVFIGDFKESLTTRQPHPRLTSKLRIWRDLFFFNLHAKYQLSTRHRLQFYSRTDRQTKRQTHTRFSAMAAEFQDVPRQNFLYYMTLIASLCRSCH